MAVGRKDEGHVHDVVIPGGETVKTGPPIPIPGAEPVAGEPAYPNTLRLKGDFQSCVDQVLADPNFAPQEGRSREESARAICAAKEDHGKRDPEAEFQEARVRASIAETTRDAGRLPEDGRTIFDRMRRSALRFAGQGKDQEGYAEELAWRAVRQNYGLGEFAANPQGVGGGKSLRTGDLPHARGRHPARVGAGNHAATALAGRGSFLVPISPGRAVVALASTREAAVKLVRANWHAITADQLGERKNVRMPKASGNPLTPFRSPFHVEQPRLKWCRQSKIYYRTPERASQRIAYGVAYPPWEVDLQGQYATAEEVVRMAHDFMMARGKAGEMHARWAMPDGSPAGHVVESFIARSGDPDFDAGDWVLGTKYHPEVWQGILSGRYRGLSIGGEWSLRPLDLRVAGLLEEAAA